MTEPDDQNAPHRPWYRTAPALLLAGTLALAVLVVGGVAIAGAVIENRNETRHAETRDDAPETTTTDPGPDAQQAAEAEQNLVDAMTDFEAAAGTELRQLARLQAEWDALMADPTYRALDEEARETKLAKIAAIEEYEAAEKALDATDEVVTGWGFIETWSSPGDTVEVRLRGAARSLAEGRAVTWTLTVDHLIEGNTPGELTGPVTLNEYGYPVAVITFPAGAEAIYQIDTDDPQDGQTYTAAATEEDGPEARVAEEITDAAWDAISAFDDARRDLFAYDDFDHAEAALTLGGIRPSKYGGAGSVPATAAPEAWAAVETALISYLDALGQNGAAVLNDAEAQADEVADSELFTTSRLPYDVYGQVIRDAIADAELAADGGGEPVRLGRVPYGSGLVDLDAAFLPGSG